LNYNSYDLFEALRRKTKFNLVWYSLRENFVYRIASRDYL
jgi:hypothetical protein